MTTSVVWLVLSCLSIHIVRGFIMDDASCVGKCYKHLSKTQSCQCNYACTRYRDCCQDFEAVCRHHVTHSPTVTGHSGSSSGCVSMLAIADKLWQEDPDNVPLSDFTINLGSHAIKGRLQDVSKNNLFQTVNAAKLSRPMWMALMALWDNYSPTRGRADPISSSDRIEINHFLDLVMASPVMKDAYTYVTCHNIFSGDISAFRNKIFSLWFEPYSRSGGSSKDSSGFEHVFVGEYKSSIVEGFHNWLRFYKEEKSGNLNYYGYLKKLPLPMVEQTFSWNGHQKKIDSFLVGSSPAFDMALATICILTKPNSACHFSLNGHRFSIQQYDQSHAHGLQIATAYTVF